MKKVTSSCIIKIICFNVFLILLIVFLTNYFSKEKIQISVIDENGILSTIRWDNLSSGYPFVGDDVFKEIQTQKTPDIQIIEIDIPKGHSRKLRLDFSSPDIKNSFVILQEIKIITPYKTYILSPDNIINSFNGLNGAYLILQQNGVQVLFEKEENQYIESMNLQFSTHYEQTTFIWILMICIIVFSCAVIVVRENKQIVKKVKQLCIKCYNMHPYILTFLYALLITCSIELITRQNVSQTFLFIKGTPLVFVFNLLLIWNILLLSLLIKRWCLAAFLLSIPFWLFALASYFVYTMRGTLIVYQDLIAVQYGMAILKDHFSSDIKYILGLSIISLIILIIVICFLYHIKIKSHKMKYVAIIMLIVNVACLSYLSHKNIWNTNTWDQKSQLDNGCIGTLYYSFINRKTETPAEYTHQNIQQIKQNLIHTSEIQEDGPNIIFLQIEAFMDPTVIDGLTFSSDPIPNFRKLQERFGTAHLTVPVFGGSTVNTEFEILTGLPVKWLRQGEYPYLTIATYKSVESLAYCLRDNYQTTAIHNWYGDFYNRDIVFKNLGFEEYISRETMTDQLYNDYYMSDEMFEKYLPLILNDSEEKDFIYGITVGMHGPYANTNVIPEEIIVSGNYNEADLQNVQKYVNELYKFDKVLGNIIEYFDAFDEPVIFILYGDHQPALSLLDSSKETAYIVPYVIYNNYNKKIVSKDLYTYQLSSYILEELDLSGGYITQFHQTYAETGDYQSELELLQYDILNGKHYIYNEEQLYTPEDMKLGHDIISITKVEKIDDGTLIYGTNFNLDSKIYINGKQENTIYLNSSTLKCNSQLQSSCTISVKQKGLYRSIGKEAVFEYIQD